MKFALLTHPDFQKHRTTDHVERPERLEAVEQMLRTATFGCDFLPFPARPATDQELLTCHSQAVLDSVTELVAQGGGNLDPDTYLNQHSESAARLAVGGGIDLCQAVMNGEYDRGFVAARPPGHHATPTRSMGFCLFSTVAVVAKSVASLGQRVLVFDWDVHHGNGTQDCLYSHKDTCFVSIHQSPFYPGSGYPVERGEGDGLGSIYNIPLPAGCNDSEYLLCYDRLVRPIIKRFDPHLIIVSAGFDAHHKDLLGGMNVTASGFRVLARKVAEDAESCAASGRLVGFMEGGYHLGGLAESLEATLQEWTGLPQSETPHPGAADDRVVRKVNELVTRFEL